ncbi:MAG: hypothetical protein K0Q49_160 [Haloplasmataceae bacterium]|nr:hypothetical protein [Haloplasmataceae bacterium]
MPEIFLSLTIELIVGFFGLLISLKITGKRQVSQISPFDFISAVILGEIVGNAMYDQDTNLYFILYAITLWTFLVFIIEKLTERFRIVRKLVIGSPHLVIKDGIINFTLLKKENIDFDELTSMLRSKDVFSLREVEYAIIEINGQLSVKKRDQFNSPSKADLKVNSEPSSTLNLPIILDGEVIEENLKIIGINIEMIENELRSDYINNIKDVLYAEYSISEGFYYQKRSKS